MFALHAPCTRKGLPLFNASCEELLTIHTSLTN